MKKTVMAILQEIITGRKYFSVDAIKAAAKDNLRSLNPLTVNQYLSNLKKQKFIHSAGRGWYSTIANEYKLVTEPVAELHKQILDKFPLLTYSLWSTKQLQPFAHHMMMQFVTFVFTDFDAMQSISQFLSDQGFRPLLNPQKQEVDKYFDASTHSIIVRPLITREPAEDSYATIEKILIDLFMEKERLHLMDGAEYQRIFRNLVFSNRINFARLLEYAERRKVEDSFIDSIMKPENNLILYEGRANS